MKNRCVLTGEEFYTDTDEKISPNVKCVLVKEIGNNQKFRNELISAMVEDQECKTAIARSVLSCTADSIGLPVPGTVAEFFLRLWNDRHRKRAVEGTKKVRKKNKASS